MDKQLPSVSATKTSLAFTFALGCLSLASPTTRGDQIQLLGTAQFAAETIDHSGLTNRLAGDVPHNRLGGLSAIEYSGNGDLYYVVADRGPGDGAARFQCRWHTIELKAPQGKTRASSRLVGTTLLTGSDGKPLIGLAAAFDPHGPEGKRRLDPEGIRRGPAGSLLISDEYGPDVIEFDSSGHAQRSLAIPARYLIAHPAATKEEEIASNSSGRTANAGFEGLAISPDGKRLYALAQLPLLQDTHKSKKGKPKGLNCRLLEIDLASGKPTREFLYPLERDGNKLSEILAVDDRRFLVIERDGLPGERAVHAD